MADRAWTPGQQRAVTGTTDDPAPVSEETVLPEDADDHLYAFAAGVVPALSDDLPDGRRPTFAGYGASCLDGLP